VGVGRGNAAGRQCPLMPFFVLINTAATATTAASAKPARWAREGNEVRARAGLGSLDPSLVLHEFRVGHVAEEWSVVLFIDRFRHSFSVHAIEDLRDFPDQLVIHHSEDSE
jgi:hypothetical protein